MSGTSTPTKKHNHIVVVRRGTLTANDEIVGRGLTMWAAMMLAAKFRRENPSDFYWVF